MTDLANSIGNLSDSLDELESVLHKTVAGLRETIQNICGDETGHDFYDGACQICAVDEPQIEGDPELDAVAGGADEA